MHALIFYRHGHQAFLQNSTCAMLSYNSKIILIIKVKEIHEHLQEDIILYCQEERFIFI